MNDLELDDMLNSWEAPEPPSSMRAGLLARFPAEPRQRLFNLRPRWILVFAAAMGVLAVGASFIDDATLGSTGGPWDASTHTLQTLLVHPYIAKFGWTNKRGHSASWRGKDGTLGGSSYMFDKSTKMHYGYTWTAEPLGGAQYRFSVLPLDPSAVTEEGPIAPLARPIPPITVHAGNTFEVDLYASGNERVYERYELSSQPIPPPPLEGPDIITLTKPQLYINGAFAFGPGAVVQASSTRVSVEAPNRGTYTLTLQPWGDRRFLLAGTAKDKDIEFRVGNDAFRIACTATVTRGGARDVYVYVKEDANQHSSDFFAGGGPGPVK